MSKVRFCSFVLLMFVIATVSAQAQTFDAVKDSGYFGIVDSGMVLPTPNNLGAHTHVPVGTANNERINRSVFEFDLSSIPGGTTINGARFEFEVTLQGGPNGEAPADFGLYRVTSAWDEGTGTSNIGEVTDDGVTWSMRTAADLWVTEGGDFDPTVVGSVFVDGPATYSIENAALQAIIQDMVDGVIPNNGFLLKADPETILGSAARVSTREGGNAAKLILDTGDGCVLGDVNQDSAVNLLDVSPFVDVLVAGEFQCEADTNEDGVVDLLDVGPFIDLLSGG